MTIDMTDGSQDDALVAKLRTIASRVDPVPAEAIAAARASFTWRTIDSELAMLAYDSAVEEPALAGVRGGTERLLTFEGAGVSIDLEVTTLRDVNSIAGQVSSPVDALELRRADGAVIVAIDDLGRFAVDVAPGSISFRCVLPMVSGQPPRVLCTDWVTL